MLCLNKLTWWGGTEWQQVAGVAFASLSDAAPGLSTAMAGLQGLELLVTHGGVADRILQERADRGYPVLDYSAAPDE